MGSVSFGAPREIIEKVRATFQVSTFVETGTYRGDTAAWASERFDRVLTIEGSPEFQRQAQERHAQRGNIEFLLGDSRSMLREVLSRLGSTPALFWLDAHWMPGSFGKAQECPLLEEIEAIYQSPAEHFILIDDARLFLAPPPLPHRASDWPDISTVLTALGSTGRPANYTVVYNDVIISLPGFARETMRIFYQEQITAAPGVNSQPVNLSRNILRGIKRRLRGAIGYS
jgi:hypothetical protein